MITDSGLNS